MKIRRLVPVVLVFVALLASARTASAEPTFLAKGETRCSACHYSPTGGGLLNDYGRLMSRQEISSSDGDREGFLWGALGDKLGPVHLGIDIRPAHLHIAFPGGNFGSSFVMNADVLAAYQMDKWTLYGEVGHRPEIAGGGVYSYEYWGARQLDKGWSLRAGRFFPAYGVRLADHTAFNRADLGFDKYDQVFGLEVSQSSAHRLVQLSVGPGRAESVLNESGRQAFTTSGRVQFDLSPKTVLVTSGIFRTSSETVARNGSGGVALGFSPTARITNWSEVDARFRDEADGQSLILVNETAFEAIPGLWLKFSPQLRTGSGNGTSPGVTRLALAATFLPRTHWDVDLSYYHDRANLTKTVTHTSLLQLHLYL